MQAGILPNPQLGYGLEFPTGGDTVGTVNAFGLTLSWDLAQLVSRAARLKASQAKKVSVDLDVAWREWQTAQAAKAAVYRLASLEKQVALAGEIKARLVRNLDLVRRAVGRQRMTLRDMVVAEAAVNQAKAALLALQKQAQQQRLNLKRLLGLRPDSMLVLQKGVRRREGREAPSPASLLTGLQARRLDLVALRLGYQSQEAKVHAAVLAQFPKINLGLIEARDTGNVVTTGFTISISLPIFDRNQGQIALERATRQQLFDEYVSRVFQARADVAKLLAHLHFVKLQLSAAREALPCLQRMRESYRTAVAQGLADVLTYYTAWNHLSAKRIEILKLKQEMVETQIGLELASGLYRLPPSSPIAAARLAGSKRVQP
jgi:outer membrane protein TolC